MGRDKKKVKWVTKMKTIGIAEAIKKAAVKKAEQAEAKINEEGGKK